MLHVLHFTISRSATDVLHSMNRILLKKPLHFRPCLLKALMPLWWTSLYVNNLQNHTSNSITVGCLILVARLSPKVMQGMFSYSNPEEDVYLAKLVRALAFQCWKERLPILRNYFTNCLRLAFKYMYFSFVLYFFLMQMFSIFWRSI